MRLPTVLRGEVWIGDLDSTVGPEVQKTRPVLIVSPNSMNRHLQTVTVMPMTTGSQAAPFRVSTGFGDREGFVLADQLRTLDRQRFRQRLGLIDQPTLQASLAILRDMFHD